MTRSPLAALGLFAALAAVQPAQAAPPRNDNYLASLRMNDSTGALPARFGETVDTSEATTQADLFDPSRDGQPFGGSGPEPTSCAAAPSYAKTIWYDFVPPTPGAVSIRTTGFDSVFAVYEFSLETAQLGKLIACQNASAGVTEERQIQRPLRAGHGYTIQVGGVNGAAGPLDFAFEFFADRDGDELFDEAPDKCLTLPGIPAFGGCPPVVRGSSRVLVANVAGGVRITRMLVDRGDRGARIQVSCGRCGPAARARVSGSGTVRIRGFEGRTVQAGDSVRVRITRPRTKTGRFRFGAFGKVIRWPITSAGLGRSRLTCLRPGSGKEIRCP
jgi:ribosomal protein S17